MCDQQPNPDNVRAEYSALISYHNSIVTHRFTLLGFFLAAIGIIIKDGVKPQDALFVLALTITLYIVERRNRVLYTQMSKRAMEIEEKHWQLIKSNDENKIVELPLFCRFQYKELRNELKERLLPELKQDLGAKPKFWDKWDFCFLPASHSLGLDLVYSSVAFYAVVYLIYHLFK